MSESFLHLLHTSFSPELWCHDSCRWVKCFKLCRDLPPPQRDIHLPRCVSPHPRTQVKTRVRQLLWPPTFRCGFSFFSAFVWLQRLYQFNEPTDTFIVVTSLTFFFFFFFSILLLHTLPSNFSHNRQLLCDFTFTRIWIFLLSNEKTNYQLPSRTTQISVLWSDVSIGRTSVCLSLLQKPNHCRKTHQCFNTALILALV